MTKTFEIYEQNMDIFKKKMKRLEKKAEKISGNGNAIVYNVTGHEFRQDKSDKRIVRKVILVEVTEQEILRIDGWEFAGVIKHMTNGNVLNKMPFFEQELPEKFQKVSTICEHCNTNRIRKDTYILFNTETAEFKQVGKSCLKDFFGHKTPEQLAGYYENLLEIDADGWQDSSLLGGYYGKEYYELQHYLELAKTVIDIDGYVSKKRMMEIAEQGGCIKSTTDEISDILCGKRYIGKIAKEVTQYVLKVIDYIKDIDVQNEYERNLKTLANEECISLDVAGYVTSMISYYQRAIDRITELENRREQLASSEHVSEIGKRIELTLTVNKVIPIETIYGTLLIHTMSDATGNQFVWKTTAKNLGEENTINLKATIKGHGEYNEVKQTELSRCKVL